MKLVIEINNEQYKYLKKRIEFNIATEMDKIVWNGKPLDKAKEVAYESTYTVDSIFS